MVECFVEMGQIGQDYGLKQRLMDKSELDHVTQVIGYHPSYLEHFLKIQNFILRGDGPLPYAYRHYLAIMAAARHQCIYLINLHTQEFIDQGGDPNWLKGLDHIPPKLRAIYDINKILAHRPWLLNTEHIERLTKGQHNWSLSEVVHAIVLLSHFHSLSSFVYSCGRTQELEGKAAPPAAATTVVKIIQHKPGCNCKNRDQPVVVVGGNPLTAASATGTVTATGPNAAAAAADIKQEVSVAALMARMITLAEKSYECSETELSNRFKHVEQQAAELPAIVEHPVTTSTSITSSSSAASATNPPSTVVGLVEPVPLISHLVDDPAFTYQDFQRRGNTENIPSTFRIQDYSWDDHGYSLVNRLYNDVGNLLDDKFRAAYNLTYHTMADRTNVDTSKFRRAIWNYIQCMFGIRHDDYDYGEVNQLLERSLKMFIKTACCFPERITKKDYDSILCELQHSEKVHINLMILEARNQAELLYALREIMRYMT